MADAGYSLLPGSAAAPRARSKRAVFWLLSHRDLRDNTRLQVVRKVISDSLLAREALFRGAAPRHADPSA